jgi:hypothetical protein
MQCEPRPDVTRVTRYPASPGVTWRDLTSPGLTWRDLALLLALLSFPRFASAQTATDQPRFLYGLSVGPGNRSTDGQLPPSTVPPGAAQPGFHGLSTTFGMEGGVLITPRLAATTFFDQTFGPGSGPGHWGTADWHGTVRGWMTRRIWLEAGGGLAGLAYKPRQNVSVTITRLWSPGFSAAAGAEVLRGAHVSLNVYARYTTSEFDGLKVRRFSAQIGLLGRQ